MKRLAYACLFAPVLSAAAWADDSAANVTSTSWDIYGFVVLVFVVAMAYAFWYQRREKTRKDRQGAKPAGGATPQQGS